MEFSTCNYWPIVGKVSKYHLACISQKAVNWQQTTGNWQRKHSKRRSHWNWHLFMCLKMGRVHDSLCARADLNLCQIVAGHNLLAWINASSSWSYQLLAKWKLAENALNFVNICRPFFLLISFYLCAFHFYSLISLLLINMLIICSRFNRSVELGFRCLSRSQSRSGFVKLIFITNLLTAFWTLSWIDYY